MTRGQGHVTHAWLSFTHNDQCVDQVWCTYMYM